ncbi:hypothetical protein PoB_005327700 [Plakobranchus ocellatus]|uniref:Uncharacterized protein n=1 Tax=Plakobranchus ocellatus TaxID=259542 RepID=A0AAV4C5B3_9GAST|nr:hypothetical protein PoB_005327700 [Plakobranchus ocellatus]
MNVADRQDQLEGLGQDPRAFEVIQLGVEERARNPGHLQLNKNGFIHVRFRVVGNLDRFQRLDLDALRAYVARLLDVPQEFIFLVGVQQGSVILTFMIFEQFTEQLRDMFEKHKDSFSPFGVDGIFVVDPPTVDEREENIRDSSTQTYMEVAPVGDIQSQLSVMYDRQNQMTSQLGELKETTDDRLNQVTSQLVALEMTTDDRLSQMTSQISGLKETTVTSQLDDLAKNIYDRLNQVTSHLLVLKQATGSPSHRAAKSQGSQDTGPLSHRVAKSQSRQVTGPQSHRVAKSQGYFVTGPPSHRVDKSHGH